jgi:hypothetical protein
MHPPEHLTMIADRLAAGRELIADFADEAGTLLAALGPVGDRALDWLAHLDRAIGVEPTATIDTTIRELRTMATAREISHAN